MSEPDSPSRTERDLRPDDAAVLVRTAQLSLDEAAAMTCGWTRRRLLDVALTLARVQSSNIAGTVIPHKPLGERIRRDEMAWNDDDLREAHGRFNGGDRSAFAIAGERIYNRLRARQYYAKKTAS